MERQNLKRPHPSFNQTLCPRKKRAADESVAPSPYLQTQPFVQVPTNNFSYEQYERSQPLDPNDPLDVLGALATQLLPLAEHEQFSYDPHMDARFSAVPCTSPPCNDPTCDDAIPCADTAGHAQACDSAGCVGEICFSASCDDVKGCEEPCADATACVSPCYSQACNEEPCHDACMDDDIFRQLCPDDSYYQPQYQTEPHFGTYDEHLTAMLSCGCVDPQCLSKDFCSHPSGHENGLANPHMGVCCGAKGVPTKAKASHNHTSFHQSSTHHVVPYNFDMPLGMASNDPSTPALTATSAITTPSLSATTPQPFHGQTVDGNIHACRWLDSGQACGMQFSCAADLHAHTEKAHVEGLSREDVANHGFFCHWDGCDRYFCRSFTARPKLKRHLQTHTLHKPFACAICGIMMKTKDAMEKHERTHTGTRPYSCTFESCNKTFATSTELKTHMVVHSGAKPHTCSICGESFADSSNLSKHKKTHFLGMWKCEVCGVRMKRWDQMRRHVQTQKHMPEVLENELVQRDYKARMEREWKSLPDEERVLQKKIK